MQEDRAGERVALPPRVMPKKMDVRLIKDFKAFVPPVFRGGINFLEAEHWLKEVKKILDVLEVPEERRVSLASFMLRDEADSWWDMVKSTHDVPHMGWTQFEELLLAKYFPEAMRRTEEIGVYAPASGGYDCNRVCLPIYFVIGVCTTYGGKRANESRTVSRGSDAEHSGSGGSFYASHVQ